MGDPPLRIRQSVWAIFGKQNWRCGMNQTPGCGARVCPAHETPERALVNSDSRTVAMEAGTR